ncbi:MAG: Xaa-Pro peptidase family protein [Chloroflexota bacterium]
MFSQSRIDQLVANMKRDGLDSLLIVSPTGTCYLSGCYLLTQLVIPEREAYVLLTQDGSLSYLVCNLEEKSARHHSHIEDIHLYIEFAEMPANAAGRLLREKGGGNGRVGIEAHALSAASLSQLTSTCPQAEFIPWDEPFKTALMIKSKAEAEAVQAAGRATQQAIIEGFTQSAPDSRELDVANRILSGIMNAGIHPLFNVFAAGPNMLETHATASERVLERGEIVRIDMGGRQMSNHYLADMARTAVVGPPSAEQITIYSALTDIQKTVMDACQPGKPISSLYELCVEKYSEHNLPFMMPHIGHGMGIDLHEAPMINAKNQTLIQPGMILNIEPFVALPGRNESYHIEDLVWVTDEAPQYLTYPNTTLIEIPA